MTLHSTSLAIALGFIPLGCANFSDEVILIEGLTEPIGFEVVLIDDPDGGWAQPSAVNNRLHVVGRLSRPSSPSRAFLWHNEQTTEIQFEGAPHYLGSEANDINDRGNFVGMVRATSDPGGTYGFSHIDGTRRYYGEPVEGEGKRTAEALRINESNRVLVTTAEVMGASLSHTWAVWNRDAIEVESPPWQAEALNDKGIVAGGDIAGQPAILNPGLETQFSLPSTAWGGVINDMNAIGAAAGAVYEPHPSLPSLKTRLCRWTPQGVPSVTDWWAVSDPAINEKGTIVGWGHIEPPQTAHLYQSFRWSGSTFVAELKKSFSGGVPMHSLPATATRLGPFETGDDGILDVPLPMDAIQDETTLFLQVESVELGRRSNVLQVSLARE